MEFALGLAVVAIVSVILTRAAHSTGAGDTDTGASAGRAPTRGADGPPGRTATRATAVHHAGSAPQHTPDAPEQPRPPRRGAAGGGAVGRAAAGPTGGGLEPMADADAAPYIGMTVGHPPKARYYRARLSGGAEVVVGHTPGADHLDVFAPTRRREDGPGQATGGRRRYGFDARGSHWTYGDAPHGAREIRALLRHLEPSIQARERL